MDGPKRKAIGRQRDLRQKSKDEKWEIQGTCLRFLLRFREMRREDDTENGNVESRVSRGCGEPEGNATARHSRKPDLLGGRPRARAGGENRESRDKENREKNKTAGEREGR